MEDQLRGDKSQSNKRGLIDRNSIQTSGRDEIISGSVFYRKAKSTRLPDPKIGKGETTHYPNR